LNYDYDYDYDYDYGHSFFFFFFSCYIKGFSEIFKGLFFMKLFLILLYFIFYNFHFLVLNVFFGFGVYFLLLLFSGCMAKIIRNFLLYIIILMLPILIWIDLSKDKI
jgi:hypothetical protein